MSTPTDGIDAAAASRADDALRALAAGPLNGNAPALLVRTDGTIIGASATGHGLVGNARHAALELAATLARIATTLRPGRPPRLERIRLPGRLTPATFACSLVAAEQSRALLLVAVDGVKADSAKPPAPPVTEPAPEITIAPAATLPLRFTWRTGVDARLSHIDPRLAAALERPIDEINGRDWHGLGAPVADRAVKAGVSFNHLPVQIPTARGDALDVELGGAPVRGDGMRGFGIVKSRSALIPTPPTAVATAPEVVAATPVIAPPAAAAPSATPPIDRKSVV